MYLTRRSFLKVAGAATISGKVLSYGTAHGRTSTLYLARIPFEYIEAQLKSKKEKFQ